MQNRLDDFDFRIYDTAQELMTEDGSFMLSEVISLLQKVEKKYGNVKVVVQYRNKGEDCSGKYDSLYFMLNKKTNTLIL